MTEEPRRVVLLDLILTIKEELVGYVKIKVNFGCNAHEIVEFRILKLRRRVKSELTALDLKRADFGRLKELLGKVAKDEALEGRPGHRSWLIFKDHFLQA